MGAPSGTVTFLFTDIEGSTALWESAPEAMGPALASHDEIVRGAIEAHGGHVFSTGGDGFAAAFARPEDAAAAAAEAQAALGGHLWPGVAPIRVRMALHTGAAEERGGDYFGPAVNRTARLMALGHGGQVLCSSVTAELVGGTEFVDLGEHRLQDLTAPQRVLQLGSGRFPPLRSLDAFPGNLPLQVSSFVGRDAELARAEKALDEARVVTLTGVGGVGKTRLALQTAARVLPRFRDGAWVVELAPVRDPEGVAGAVAAVFAVNARGGMSIEESLIEFLRAKRVLVVVDNAEHLLEAVAGVVDALERSCPGVVVLVTSREGLALDGERVVPVPSMGAPPAGADAETAAAADSVRLFVERARAVDPDFELTAANANAVVEVCRRLDGVPLAIELAAARIGTMTPAELARGLDRRFATLAGGRRRAVQRHQTLRAAIDWSYELLADGERRLLSRLSVFAGGFTREAAEAVCAGPPLGERQVFETLAGLVAKSLVIAQRGDDETRYRLLETIREYGEDRLAEIGETEAVRAAHAEYFSELARRLHEQLFGPEQLTTARRLAADYENLLAAIGHAVDIGDADLALRLVSHMPPPGVQVGYRALLPVEAVLGIPDASGHPLYAFALGLAGSIAAFRGDLDRAEKACEDALNVVRRQVGEHDERVEWIVFNTRATISLATGAWDEAAALLAQSVRLTESSDPRTAGYAIAFNLAGASMAYTMAGHPEDAEPLATEGLARARRSGAPSYIAMNLVALAGALAGKDASRAKSLLQESLRLHETLDFESPYDAVQSTLIAARLGDAPLVLRLGLRAIRELDRGGDRPFMSGIINVVAFALAPSDAQSAAVLQGAARRFVPTPARMSPAARSEAPPSDRVPVAGAFIADARRRATAVLRAALGEEALRDLRSQGEAMNPDEAVRYTLAVIDRNLTT